MTSTRNLDFSLLPNIESMDMFIRLEMDVDKKLKEDDTLHEVYERAQAALMFFCKASEEKEDWINSAFIRAGLNEFYSLEDAARRDFKKSIKKSIKNSPKIRDSLNPLIHLMYLLRHANVHAKVSSTKVHPVSIISTLGEKSHEHSYGAIILESPILEDLPRCNEAKKYYKGTDLKSVADWFDNVQCVFGVGEVLRRGLSAYCRELLKSAKGET